MFLLTNSYNKSLQAHSIWKNLYDNSTIAELPNEFHLVSTKGYSEREHYYHKYENNITYGFGTFFSKTGFFGKAIGEEKDIHYFDQEMAGKLFGHYILVNSQKDKIQIVTDPVGLINIFWAKIDGEIFVSSDQMLLARILDKVRVSEYGIHEFVLNENTIGSDTLFSEIKRLRLGDKLIIENQIISNKKFYDYNPTRLTFEEYLNRIETYFKALNLYEGTLASELSAGYDSRLVSICAERFSDNIIGIVNDNRFDRGVDLATADLIADKLKIPLKRISRNQKSSLDEERMLHSFAIGRDAIRSKAMIEINEKKYEHADLILGGYGGEILRAKYSNYSSLDEFIANYYNGNILLEWNLNETYSHIKNILTKEYSQDWIKSPGQLANWLYSMDRMRIWGGSAVVGKFMHGDRLHPFMDWYLMEPIFKWNSQELANANLMIRIMDRLAPELANIPFNTQHPSLLDNIGSRKIFILNKTYQLQYLLKRIRRRFGSSKREKVEQIYKIFPRENFSDTSKDISKLDAEKLELSRRPDYLSRYATVQMAESYSQNSSMEI